MQKSAAVRDYVRREYIEPARRRGQSRVTVVAGDVHKAVGLKNLVPLVCQALKSKKILQENHIVLEKVESPAASEQSTTVAFTYRIDSSETEARAHDELPTFVTIRGI